MRPRLEHPGSQAVVFTIPVVLTSTPAHSVCGTGGVSFATQIDSGAESVASYARNLFRSSGVGALIAGAMPLEASVCSVPRTVHQSSLIGGPERSMVDTMTNCMRLRIETRLPAWALEFIRVRPLPLLNTPLLQALERFEPNAQSEG